MIDSKSKFFLGIDGGASKTHATVIDQSGQIVSQAQGDGANYHNIGLKQTLIHLNHIVQNAIKK